VPGFIAAVLAAALRVLWWLIAHPLAAVPLGIFGWAVFVLLSPYRTCRWCRAGGWLARLPGPARCWRCHGRKLTRRLGAYHAHKVKLSLQQAWDEREWWR
jgi:hypothetical protein